jgi:hypothetical protein
MTTPRTRSAAAVAWVLGILLAIAQPQAVNAAGLAIAWILTTTAGSIVLAVGFFGSLYWVARGRLGWS